MKTHTQTIALLALLLLLTRSHHSYAEERPPAAGTDKTIETKGTVEGPRNPDLFKVDPDRPSPFVDIPSNQQIPLRYYVYKELEEPALLVQKGNYQSALKYISAQKPSYLASFWERLYLKALCLQSLRRYKEAISEYELVRRNTKDERLVMRACLGERSCHDKNRKLTREQLFFPQIGPFQIREIRPTRRFRSDH